MAAKNYVLGAVLRRLPSTMLNGSWCVYLRRPSFDRRGDAVPVELPDGKKGIDMTFTIRPDANWGTGRP